MLFFSIYSCSSPFICPYRLHWMQCQRQDRVSGRTDMYCNSYSKWQDLLIFFFFLVASLIKSSLVSLTGRFDLRRTQFLCSSCGKDREATPENYIESGYFPGTTSSISCYFSIELIEFWNILKHETPGTSERKFVKTLEIISKMRGRVSKLRNFKR